MESVKTKGRLTTILLGTLALLGLVMAALSQKTVLMRSYRHWRLDQVDAWEKAAPLLEALASDAGRSADPNLLVYRLGSAHPRYTFWFFAALQHEPHRIALRPALVEPFQAFQVRLKDDSELMAMWIQFLRWRGDHHFLNSVKERCEAALARVEYARIVVMPKGDEQQHALLRWISEYSPYESDMFERNPPTEPFPNWTRPVPEPPR